MTFKISTEEIYRVKLELFEGPLDLLLHLIEREELDITKISLAQVTDQYLAYIDQVEELHAENLADFLVVAARLILIKSQMLLPRPKSSSAVDEGEEDPGEALARQLREYKRFKEIAQYLKERAASGARAFVRIAPPPKLARKIDLRGVTQADLAEAMRRVLLNQSPDQPPAIISPKPTITIIDQMTLLKQRLAQTRRITFDSLLAESRSRLEVIITFLAILEMFKAGEIVINQDNLFDEIFIETAPQPGAIDKKKSPVKKDPPSRPVTS